MLWFVYFGNFFFSWLNECVGKLIVVCDIFLSGGF